MNENDFRYITKVFKEKITTSYEKTKQEVILHKQLDIQRIRMRADYDEVQALESIDKRKPKKHRVSKLNFS